MKKIILSSIMAITLVYCVTCCGKSKANKSIDGTWDLITISEDGVDFFTATGGTLSGQWTFNKSAKTIDYVQTVKAGTETITETGSSNYSVTGEDELLIDGEEFTISELTSRSLKLVNTDNYVIEYSFSK